MNFVSLIYDILAVVIVIGCIKKGAKDGFAKTAVQTIGYICSTIAALVISSIAATLIYSTIIEPALIEHIETAISGAVDAESLKTNLVSALKELPAVSFLLFDLNEAIENLSSSVSMNFYETAKTVTDNVIAPVLEPILKVTIFALSTIVLFAVVSLVAKGSKVLNSVPVISGANRFFGGVFGIVNGALSLCVAAVILRMVITSGIFPEYFSESIIEKTYLFKMIYFPVCGYIF